MTPVYVAKSCNGITRARAPLHLLDISPGKLESEFHFGGLCDYCEKFTIKLKEYGPRGLRCHTRSLSDIRSEPQNRLEIDTQAHKDLLTALFTTKS